MEIGEFLVLFRADNSHDFTPLTDSFEELSNAESAVDSGEYGQYAIVRIVNTATRGLVEQTEFAKKKRTRKPTPEPVARKKGKASGETA